MPKMILAKRNLFRTDQGSNTQPSNYKASAQPIHASG